MESSLLDREQSRCRTGRTHRHDHGQAAIGRTRRNLHVDARGTPYHACETHRRRRSADRNLRRRGQRERIRRHHGDQCGSRRSQARAIDRHGFSRSRRVLYLGSRRRPGGLFGPKCRPVSLPWKLHSGHSFGTAKTVLPGTQFPPGRLLLAGCKWPQQKKSRVLSLLVERRTRLRISVYGAIVKPAERRQS